MSDLGITTHITGIEQALQSAILHALGSRLTVATVAALRSVASASTKHDELRYVTAAGFAYKFNRYSTAADDGAATIKPTDNPTAGRWIKTTSTVTSGYLKAVELYDGEATGEEIIKRFKGARPGVMIYLDQESFTPRSGIAGALYDIELDFALHCVSSNMRGEHQAATGSQISAESTADPGINKIIGDVANTLAGSTLSDQEGIKYVEILRVQRESASLADRLLVYSLRIKVYGSVHLPSTDTVALGSHAFNVTYQLGDAKGEDEFDESNYLTDLDGIRVPTGAGLTKSITAGTAKIGGSTVNYAGQSKAFTASRDTYRDLNPNGTLTFAEVLNGYTAPDVTSGALRIGKTVTDASGVVEDVMLVQYLETLISEDQVPVP